MVLYTTKQEIAFVTPLNIYTTSIHGRIFYTIHWIYKVTDLWFENDIYRCLIVEFNQEIQCRTPSEKNEIDLKRREKIEFLQWYFLHSNSNFFRIRGRILKRFSVSWSRMMKVQESWMRLWSHMLWINTSHLKNYQKLEFPLIRTKLVTALAQNFHSKTTMSQ